MTDVTQQTNQESIEGEKPISETKPTRISNVPIKEYKFRCECYPHDWTMFYIMLIEYSLEHKYYFEAKTTVGFHPGQNCTTLKTNIPMIRIQLLAELGGNDFQVIYQTLKPNTDYDGDRDFSFVPSKSANKEDVDHIKTYLKNKNICNNCGSSHCKN